MQALSPEVFFHLSPDLMCIASFEGYFKELSPKWEQVLGWSIHELTSRPYIEFVHPDDRHDTIREKDTLAKGGAVFQFQNRYRCRNGSYRWIEWNATAIADGVAAVGRDITEHRDGVLNHLEIQRRADFFQYLVENTLDPVYIISPSDGFRFYYVNEATCRHYGICREHLLKMSIPDWDPNFTRATCDVFWERVKSEKTTMIETAHILRSGQTIPVEVTANYLSFGGMEYIAGFIRDISERKEMQERLSQFASIASHDLQEPLRTMSTYLSLMERRITFDETTTQYAHFVKDAASRMTELIRTILSHSKTGKETAKNEFTDLNLSVGEVIDSLEKNINETGTIITVGQLPTVPGNRFSLEQLFQNLITNAIKFRGPEPARISITALEQEKDWLLCVSDNGIGIEPDHQSRVFEMFYRTGQNPGSSGTGIGLATCKRVVSLLGGKIWLESKLGEGSKFFFTIPKIWQQKVVWDATRQLAAQH